jgi:hypothetical protein
VEIHRSARRHGVPDDDITHAYINAIAWLELDDDPPRYLVAGPNTAGNLLELVLLETGDGALVIHAMPLRTSTRRALFDDSEEP